MNCTSVSSEWTQGHDGKANEQSGDPLGTVVPVEPETFT
jgi:hypothetical protein